MERPQSANGPSRRWSCEACGCNTNSESDRNCTICGTSNGSSVLRRAGYAARAGLFARSVAARRSFMSEELGMEGYEVWDRADDDAEMHGDEDEHVIAALAMEVANVSGSDAARQRSVLEAARSFAMTTRETNRPDPSELLRSAYDNGSEFQPKWMNPSQVGGRMRTANGIEVGDGENQNIAHLPIGAGEGRALRALAAFPRSAPFASFNLATRNNSGRERRPRRAFGFRVAFEHPTKERGKGMGGHYLIGVTTTSFAAFSERNALQQSPHFWGIEDSGNKYEGPRTRVSRDGRHGQSVSAIELSPTHVTRNADNVLFGSREIITCVVDMESRSLTCWRDEELLGTLITNLPRGGNLYPIVVPYNAGSTVAITGMGSDPLPLLRSFATDWKQVQVEKDALCRQKLLAERSKLIIGGMLTPELTDVLRIVFTGYSNNSRQPNVDNDTPLSRVDASRLWYRCGMKLSNLDDLCRDKPHSTDCICFKDFLDILNKVIVEEGTLDSQKPHSFDTAVFQAGDKVELVEGYERFGDASNGPLHPGERGTVVDLQEGPDGERLSVRVIHNSRRWWYQPQALVREKSGLTESPGVWFLKTILRAHGYDHTSLQLLAGKKMTGSSWQVGDVVSPKSIVAADKPTDTLSGCIVLDTDLGRIVAENSTSTSSLTSRGRESGSVLVEFISTSFAVSAGIQTGSSLRGSALSLETRRVPVSRLVHSASCQGAIVRSTNNVILATRAADGVQDMDTADSDCGVLRDPALPDKVREDLNKMTQLDVTAVENITKECKQNATTLSALFAAGLPDSALKAIDSASKQIRRSDNDETLAQVVTALGKLALTVAEKAFTSESFVAEATLGRSQEPTESASADSERESSIEIQRQRNGIRRNEPRGLRSSIVSDSALFQEVGRVGRSSSLQQRRNMLLALMSRARRSHNSGSSDVLDRQSNSDDQEASVSNIDPFRQDAAALLLGPSNHFPAGNGWEDVTVDADEEECSMENRLSSVLSRRTGASSSSARPTAGDETALLDTILRGQMQKIPAIASFGKTSECIEPSTLKTIFINGLLGNSLSWLQAALESHSKVSSTKQTTRRLPLLHETADEDGMPILQVAISLGCSLTIIRHVIRLGAPVGDAEIKMAAETDQPKTLSELLQSSVFPDGLADLNSCSLTVTAVVRDASLRQEMQRQTVREGAAPFLISMLQQLLKLGLSCRHRSLANDQCSCAVAGALVGNVVLAALQKRQVNGKSPTSRTVRSDSSTQEESVPSGEHRDQVVESASSGLESRGLIHVLPDKVLGRSLSDNLAHITNLLALIEDYLCSKDINDSAIGLTLLLTLLERQPALSQSSEIERYGLSELVSSHDAFALNRLADLSSRVTTGKASSATEQLSEAEVIYSTAKVLCPKGHSAALHITRHSSFRCDLCGKGVECGRVMHGCRDCDWDACEKCTDRAEGGIVKWNCIRELASKCNTFLSPLNKLEGAILGKRTEWEEKLVESMAILDNSPDVNNLSRRLLQREHDSLRDLASMLTTPGELTIHQFLRVILPTLHAALVGRPSEQGETNLDHPVLSRRSKRPRVLGSSGREVGETAHVSSWEDRLEFASQIHKYLVHNATEDQVGDRHEKGTRRPYEDANQMDQDSDADHAEENDPPLKQQPEILRRLHKILALYENVPTMPALQRRPGTSSLSRLELRSLKKPVHLRLLPTASKAQSGKSSLQAHNSLLIHAEPLISVQDLSYHVLRACRISHNYYTTFCRSLANDRAVIIERGRGVRKNQKSPWRIAKVNTFDEDHGWHSVSYACSSEGSEKRLELRSSSLSDINDLEFESKETKLVLAARELFVISRENVTDEGESKSTFDMDLLLTDGIVRGTEAHEHNVVQHPSVGARIESNFLSSEWNQFTILAEADGRRRMSDLEFVLVSDEGEVLDGVPSSRIRGLKVNEDPPGEDVLVESRVGADLVRESRGRVNRTFPFLSVRRLVAEEHRGDARNSPPKPAGVLKRTWSALALTESMCPIEVNIGENRRAVNSANASSSGLSEWRCICNIGSHEVELFVEQSILEPPPRLRVDFYGRDKTFPLFSPSSADTTLMSLLWQLYQKDSSQLCGDQVFELFYEFTLEDRDNEYKDEKSSNVPSFSIPSARFEGPGQDKNCRRSEAFLRSENSPIIQAGEVAKPTPWPPAHRARKLIHLSSYGNDEAERGLCDGFDEICVQCMEIIGLLAGASRPADTAGERKSKVLGFENKGLSEKLIEQLDDPLMVVGGALPPWCFVAPAFAPRVFSYESRRLVLERAAFGVSRSALQQQESKVNVGRLRQRMASLRGRAVELVGEAFSGGAEDPTALQLQADELYGMEEALAARVKAAFRAEKWEEHALQVAKAAVRRDLLITDAFSLMDQYAIDDRLCRRRLEVRFDGESGFDAASGDEAGVTRGFYADVAEALLSCDIVAGVGSASICPDGPGSNLVSSLTWNRQGLPCRMPLWIPDVDSSGQVVIPTPRADPLSELGVYPRPLSNLHPLFSDVLEQFRFIGRLFAAAMRDSFMFPLPLSSAFLKLVQDGSDDFALLTKISGLTTPVRPAMDRKSNLGEVAPSGSGRIAARDGPLDSCDLPRPGFLGGEVFAVEMGICRALDQLDQIDPPLSRDELERRYNEIASDKNFARAALGKSYDCSFEEYFEDRVFVDPLDPSQGIEAMPLCANGQTRNVSIHCIREWVGLAKQFILHDGVISQALAFRQGVDDFFSADYLRLFAPEELQRDVCGVGDNVDSWDETEIRKLFKLDGKGAVEALVAVAAIGGEGGAALSRRFGPSSPTIKYVVQALLEATPKMRRQFLSFVTSVPIVTPGQIEVVPVVSPQGEFVPMKDPGCLPRANTCSRRLYLPKFESYESFSQVLWAIVREESKFKGFYEWRGD